MIQSKETKIVKLQTAHYGVAIAEYGLLLALVVVVTIGGLTLLGNSNFNLFAQSGNAMSELGYGEFTPLKDMSDKQLAVTGAGVMPGAPGSKPQSKIYLKGGGYYTMIVDPASGQPILKLINGTSGVNVNVSSVEGSRYNALGSIMLANKLDTLAEAQTDPKLKDYYGQLAKYAYYMGGAEGVMDNVQEVSQGNVMRGVVDPSTGIMQTYTLGDGLRDIFSYRQTLQGLLENPPASLNASEFHQVMPYVMDVNNIAQNYLNNFQSFITPDGKVSQNFGDPAQCHSTAEYGGCDLGTPGPGASLANATSAVANPPNGHQMIGINYHLLVSLKKLKANAAKLLANYKVADLPVVTTFQDAEVVDAHGAR
jgi:Flp pilus assembly pilin Flp